MKRWLLVGFLVIGLGACGHGEPVQSAFGAPAASNASGPVTITIKTFKFGDGQPVTVHAGDVVHFTNADNQPHTATSDTPGVFDAGSIAAGATTDVTVATPGSYSYHCSFHPFMTATLVVT